MRSVPSRGSRGKLPEVSEIVRSLSSLPRAEEVVTAVRHLPAREAVLAPVPEWIASEVADAYRAKGVTELYSHQAEAAERIHAGRNVVIVTPTASG